MNKQTIIINAAHLYIVSWPKNLSLYTLVFCVPLYV